MIWKFLFSLVSLYSSESYWKPYGHDTSTLLKVSEYGPKTVEEFAEAHRALYSGNDMIFPSDFKLYAGIKDTKYRWPGYPGKPVVPYIIDSSLSKQSDLIKRAVEQYNKLTCVKFVEKKPIHKDYVRFVNGTGCKSEFAYQKKGEQQLTLGKGCYYIGTIVHEIGHTLGLYHEHQRSDRDTYLTVFKNNVIQGMEFNFDITPANHEEKVTPFNHNSIMIYGNYAFSKSPGKLMTMVAKNKTPLYEPYTKPGLDNTDIDQVKKFYKCK